MKRRPREQCGVSVFFTLLPAAGIDAPAVANNEHNRASHTRGNFADDYEDRQAGSFLDASLRGARPRHAYDARVAPLRGGRLQRLINIY